MQLVSRVHLREFLARWLLRRQNFLRNRTSESALRLKSLQPHFLHAEVTWALLGRVYSFALGFLERAAFIIPAGLSVGIKIYTERELQFLKLHSFSCNIDMTAGASSRTVHWHTKQLLIPTWGVATQKPLFEGLGRVLGRKHETRGSIFAFPC